MHEHAMRDTAEHDFSDTAAPTRADHDEVCGDGLCCVEDDLSGAADLIDPSHVADVCWDHGRRAVEELSPRIDHGVAEIIVPLQVSGLGDDRIFKHTQIDSMNEGHVGWTVGMKRLRHSREGLIGPINADGDPHPVLSSGARSKQGMRSGAEGQHAR
jgi:hypothetical protein